MKNSHALAVNFLLICSVLFQSKIYSIEKERYTIGGTGEILQSRFIQENRQSKTNEFGMIEYSNYTIFAERRGERNLGSLQYQNDLIYLSAGHRFRAVPGFYLLRDKKYYSAFQNPSDLVIPQPLEKSLWAGGFWRGWGAGIFMGKNISEKNLSYYIKSPEEKFAITHSPEKKYSSIYLDFRNMKLEDRKGEPEVTISSQIQGDKINYFGYFNSKLIVPRDGLEAELSLYRESKGNLFAMTQENSQILPNSKAAFGKFSHYHYDRLEAFTEKSSHATNSVFGINAALISGKYGAFCAKGRNYSSTDIQTDQTTSTISGGISYEYRLKTTEFLLGIEKRKNRDRLAELKFTIRPIPDLKFEISSVVQGNENQFRSLFEQWSDGENVNTILTDRSFIYKMKISGSFLVFNISGSRKKDGKGEVYFANIQFKISF